MEDVQTLALKAQGNDELDFLTKGYFFGYISKIYERSLRKSKVKYKTQEGEKVTVTVSLNLPASWVETWEDDPNSLILLQTKGGHLIIVNPNNVGRLLYRVEWLFRDFKVRPDLGRKPREKQLWKVVYKFRGPWKAAELRTKRARGGGGGWLQQVTIGGRSPRRGRPPKSSKRRRK